MPLECRLAALLRLRARDLPRAISAFRTEPVHPALHRAGRRVAGLARVLPGARAALRGGAVDQRVAPGRRGEASGRGPPAAPPARPHPRGPGTGRAARLDRGPLFRDPRRRGAGLRGRPGPPRPTTEFGKGQRRAFGSPSTSTASGTRRPATSPAAPPTSPCCRRRSSTASSSPTTSTTTAC